MRHDLDGRCEEGKEVMGIDHEARGNTINPRRPAGGSLQTHSTFRLLGRLVGRR